MFKATEICKIKNGFRVYAVSGSVEVWVDVDEHGQYVDSTFRYECEPGLDLLECAIKALKKKGLLQ